MDEPRRPLLNIPPARPRASGRLWGARERTALDHACLSPHAAMWRHRRATRWPRWPELGASGSHPRGAATSAHGRPRTCRSPPRLAHRVHSSAQASGAASHAQVAESGPPSPHPCTRRHQRGMPWPPFRRCQCKLPKPSNPPGFAPLESAASRTLALYQWPPRDRHGKAATARHWHSKQPTLPEVGRVGCSE